MVEYIRELLNLPTQVNKGDFVLNLSVGGMAWYPLSSVKKTRERRKKVST